MPTDLEAVGFFPGDSEPEGNHFPSQQKNRRYPQPANQSQNTPIRRPRRDVRYSRQQRHRHSKARHIPNDSASFHTLSSSSSSSLLSFIDSSTSRTEDTTSNSSGYSGSRSGSESTATSVSSTSHPNYYQNRWRKRRQRRRRRKLRSRTQRGRLNDAILEETEEQYDKGVIGESFGRSRFHHTRTSSNSPPPAGRTKDPIAPGIYTRIRKRSATPLDFEEAFGSAGVISSGDELIFGRSYPHMSPLSSTGYADMLFSQERKDSIDIDEKAQESVAIEMYPLPTARRRTISTVKSGPSEVSVAARKSLASHRTALSAGSPTGLPIIQEFILDSQFSIIVEGRKYSRQRVLFYYALCIFTFGIIYLLGKWFPQMKCHLTTCQTSLATSTHVLVKNSFNHYELISVKRTYYGSVLNSVFGRQQVHELIVQEEPSEEENKDQIENSEDNKYKDENENEENSTMVNKNTPHSFEFEQESKTYWPTVQPDIETGALIEEEDLDESQTLQSSLLPPSYRYSLANIAVIERNEDIVAYEEARKLRKERKVKKNRRRRRLISREGTDVVTSDLANQDQIDIDHTMDENHLLKSDGDHERGRRSDIDRHGSISSLSNSSISLTDNGSDSESTEVSEPEELLFTHTFEPVGMPHPAAEHVSVADDVSVASSFLTVTGAVLQYDAASPADYLYFFEYRCIRFLYHPSTGRYFEHGQWETFQDASYSSLEKGLNSGLAAQRHVVHGDNTLSIPTRSLLSLAIDELLHPFNVFQMLSIVLWCFESYFLYALAIFAMSIYNSTSSILETTRNISFVKSLQGNPAESSVLVLRDGVWKVLDVESLVPGDLFEFSDIDQEPLVVPCDALLISSGTSLIVNESMLTGESLPIHKVPLDEDTWNNLVFKGSASDGPILQQLTRWYDKSILYGGTKILRVRGDKDFANSHRVIDENSPLSTATVIFDDAEELKDGVLVHGDFKSRALAVVLRTSFNTTKGSLIRSILFPRPPAAHFYFYRDALRCIGALAIMSFFGFSWTIFLLLKLGQSIFYVLTKSFDIITVLIPPALPAAMSIGISFALARLTKKGIRCSAPSRINMAGKMNLVAFDKTGTLTQDRLDVVGVHTIINPIGTEADTSRISSTLSESKSSISRESVGTNALLSLNTMSGLLTTKEQVIQNNASHGGTGDILLVAMATCHTLSQVQSKDDKIHMLQPVKPQLDYVENGVSCKSKEMVLVGDPLDLQMFSWTGWQYMEGNSLPDLNVPLSKSSSLSSVVIDPLSHASYAILHVFEFSSELRRQSVIVQPGCINNAHFTDDPSIDHRMYAFVKGAPEEIKDLLSISQDGSSDLVDDYDALVDHYTFRGFRVLAVGYKKLSPLPWSPASSLSAEDHIAVDRYSNPVKALRRSAVESDLTFLGFLLFDNPLKACSASVISTFQQAQFRTLLVTGDNILTAVSVASRCGILRDPDVSVVDPLTSELCRETVYIPFLSEHPIVEDSDSEDAGNISDDVDTPISGNSSCHEDASLHSNHSHSTKHADMESSSHKEKSIDGYRYLSWRSSLDARDTLDPFTLRPKKKRNKGNQNISSQFPSLTGQPSYSLSCTGRILEYLIDYCDPAVLQRVLLLCPVYARCSPGQKQRLVECLQRLDYTVCFCGDGANDCGALKASDIGISLSQAEASVAAPFTSKTSSIRCVLDLVLEGRSALASAFSIFQFMALYSLIQFTTISLLYLYGSNLGDSQYLWVDLGVILPLAICMNRLEADDKSGKFQLAAKNSNTLCRSEIKLDPSYLLQPNHALYKSSRMLPDKISSFPLPGNVLSEIISSIPSLALPRLTAKSPSASLASTRVLSRLLIQVLLAILFQGWLYTSVVLCSWYQPIVPKPNSDNIVGHLNTVMFLFSSFQYLVVFLIFSDNRPYQKSIWTNSLLVGIVVTILIFNLVFLLLPLSWITSIMEMAPVPYTFRLYILFLVCLYAWSAYYGNQMGQIFGKMIKRKLSLRSDSSTIKGKLFKRLKAEWEEEYRLATSFNNA